MDTAEMQAVPVDRLHVLPERVHEEHVESGLGELAAHHAADGTSPEHHEAHRSSSVFRAAIRSARVTPRQRPKSEVATR